MRGRRSLGLLLAAAAALVAADGAPEARPGERGGASERSVRLFEPTHRTAEGLLPIARTALGDEGRVALEPGRGVLVLAGPPEAVETALALLRERDVAPRTVLLRYEARRLESLEAAGVEIEWEAHRGSVRVGSVAQRSKRGGDEEAELRVRGGASTGERESTTAGMLRIGEGEVGRIAEGRTVPVELRGRRRARTALVTAERGFAARPRVLGDGRIAVELWPIDATVDEGGRVEHAEAATRVVVEPGESVVVGRLARSERSRGASAGSRSGAGTRQRESERVLLLTASLEEPPGP